MCEGFEAAFSAQEKNKGSLLQLGECEQKARNQTLASVTSKSQ